MQAADSFITSIPTPPITNPDKERIKKIKDRIKGKEDNGLVKQSGFEEWQCKLDSYLTIIEKFESSTKKLKVLSKQKLPKQREVSSSYFRKRRLAFNKQLQLLQEQLETAIEENTQTKNDQLSKLPSIRHELDQMEEILSIFLPESK